MRILKIIAKTSGGESWWSLMTKKFRWKRKENFCLFTYLWFAPFYGGLFGFLISYAMLQGKIVSLSKRSQDFQSQLLPFYPFK
jgi:hypothetical protein